MNNSENHENLGGGFRPANKRSRPEKSGGYDTVASGSLDQEFKGGYKGPTSDDIENGSGQQNQDAA